MTVIINIFSRLQAMNTALGPVLNTYNIPMVKIADQPFQGQRNNNINILFTGFQQHRKMDFQAYKSTWNSDTSMFDVSGSYSSMNTIFFDYYPIDYTTGLDVCQNMILTLDYTDFSAYNMTSRSFKMVDNNTDPNMLLGSVKQHYKFTADFMFYDDIIFSSAFAADGMDVQATIGLLETEVKINLD